MTIDHTPQQESPAQPAAANDPAESSGMPWATLLLTFGVCVAGFIGYRYYETPGVSSAACYRVIDMNRLSGALLNDMVDKSASMAADAAGSNYRTRLKSLDNEVTRLAGGCLLLRRDAVIMPDPALDITAQVATTLGIDIGKTPSPAAAMSAANAMAAKPAASPTPQSSGNSVQIPDALGSKLD
jgi:hypothetical protein